MERLPRLLFGSKICRSVDISSVSGLGLGRPSILAGGEIWEARNYIYIDATSLQWHLMEGARTRGQIYLKFLVKRCNSNTGVTE